MEEKDIIKLIGKVTLKDEIFPQENETWEKIQEEIEKRKRRRIIHTWYQVAASIAIMACITFGIGANVNLESENETISAYLPDGSSIELHAYASLHYNKIQWWFSRCVTLNGDAMFTVAKGKKFTTITPAGTISVLGTRFFVSQREDTLHVACFEGSVRVKTKAGEEIISPGEQINYDASVMRRSKIKEELPEYLEFTNTSLTEVVRKLEKIYGLRVVNIELCEGLSFSGLMSTRNRDEAVKVIFEVCNLKYSIKDNVLILTR